MQNGYLQAIKSGDLNLLKHFTKIGTENIKSIFKGFPSIPSYVSDAINIADWDIKYQNKFGNTLGYFLPMSEIVEGIALLKENKTWMSITPMEIESHMLAQHSAKGNVVVAGLGLGMISNSLLQKQSVKRLTILENDAELIKHYSSLLKGDSKALWEDSINSGRLQVIECDCKSRISSDNKDVIGKVDYLWVDIWATLGTKDAIIDTTFLCKELSPKTCDYWGMELDLIFKMVEEKLSSTPKSVIKVLSKIGIPNSALKMNKLQQKAYADLTIMAGMNFVVMASQQNRE